MIRELWRNLKKRFNRPYTYSDLRVPRFLTQARTLLKDYDTLARGGRVELSGSGEKYYLWRLGRLPGEIESLLREWGFSDQYLAHDDFEELRPVQKPQPLEKQYEPS